MFFSCHRNVNSECLAVLAELSTSGTVSFTTSSFYMVVIISYIVHMSHIQARRWRETVCVFCTKDIAKYEGHMLTVAEQTCVAGVRGCKTSIKET